MNSTSTLPGQNSHKSPQVRKTGLLKIGSQKHEDFEYQSRFLRKRGDLSKKCMFRKIRKNV